MKPGIARWLAPLRARVLGMIGRAVVRRIDDAHGIQELQLALLGRELAGRAERFQNYGMTSVPLPGAEALVVFPMGNREHAIAVAVDDRSQRPQNLAPGDVLLYAAGGARVRLRASDGAVLVSSPGRVEVAAPEVQVSGTNVTLTGSSSVTLSSGTSQVEVTPAGVVLTGPLIDFVQA